MDDQFFGEGICSLNDEHTKFVRMTWKDNVVNILDSSLKVIETRPMFEGPQEGWGITRYDNTLYVTDGTAMLYLIDAQTFETLSKMEVKNKAGRPVKYLNEIQYANGYLWANVFTTAWVVQIEPCDG